MEGHAGTTFAGRYQLIRRLGIGGMAEVYLARQTGLARFEKIVAVKTILPQIVESDAAVAMFIDEARIAAQLDHSNIVAVYDFGRTKEGAFYIVMEYVHGLSLSAMQRALDRRGLSVPIPIALQIMTGICRGLDYAHRKRDLEGRPLSIIHRDLDPQNILISYEGDVKIGDFGIARASEAVRLHRSADGAVKGKSNYMAPEIIRGQPIDQRADLFALGVVFYELVTGTRPFDAGNATQVMTNIAKGTVEPVLSRAPACPPGVAAAIERALALNRDDRYSTAAAMLVEIEVLCSALAPGEGRSMLRQFLATYFPEHATNDNPLIDVGRPEAVTPSDNEATKPSHPEPAPTIQTAAPSTIRRRHAIEAAAALIVAVVLAIWLARGSSTPNTQTPAGESPAAGIEAPSTPAPADSAPPGSATAPTPAAASDPAIAPMPTPGAPAQTAEARLSVNSDVGCRVHVGSNTLGETPLASAPVRAGTMTVRCVAASLGLSDTRTIKIESGGAGSVRFQFLATLNVNAVPWADVYLDGVNIGQTPLVKTDMIPGTHVVRLVNESMGRSVTRSRVFSPGDSKVISEDFTAMKE